MQKIKLFCFPYAGGSAMIYNCWNKYLDNSIEVCPLELAGRGSRFDEGLYNNFEEAVNDLYGQIKDEIRYPYGFFGHSMGSWLAFEISCRIKAEKLIDPAHIFLSGRKALHIANHEPIFHQMSDDQFVDKVLKLGGAKKEIFENKQLYDLFVPVLRSDFKIVETYNCTNINTVLNCDVSVFYSKDDLTTPLEDMEAWARYTTRRFSCYAYHGDHFFPFSNPKAVVETINEKFKYFWLDK